ncbi:ABC-F family ATP-binding cassette domain-containing protein [Bdellovibrio bacteriovorus]|uniref:ABC transporter, ATP-binding protein n=1 Tax=Bdellovibrio bacteriovorus (strain ATCC 15356 / DSM 50701 / NCIMB 9529 / HD100) TaxID=264462 RepID=Q6MN48_BDEBA|nr:ABC-F family ATP-binding cassette domain-containing protein [Bdellovibrio bacteriovorus]BEV67862.1 putative ABC transporter ATP-binding protein YheS [Bdellovibrio bacteriovorus]CAE79304.1 ABC transporter, ATP-binding protein [Bdellovibrio bacteriovorus HD100]
MIHLSNITKQQGNKVLYRNGSFQINAGEKIGLVGPNGAGKTTIFRIIMGEEGIDGGTISKSDRTVIGYFSQNIEEMKGKSALEEVKSAVGNIGDMQVRMQECEAKLADPDLDPDEMMKILEVYGELQGEFERLGGYDLESRAAEILTGLGIGPDDYHRPSESFSGGWKMRIALAKILALNPEVLLMDEPTNHLDVESIVWLEEWLVNFKGAILMTSHDRDFMNRLVGKIVEIANKTITVYGGNYDFYEKERDIRKEQLIAAAKRQEDMLAKEEEFIARFAARASHAAQVQSRVKKLEKIDRIEIPDEEAEIKFEWPVPPRGGDEVVKLEGLSKIWKRDDGKEKLVFSGANALVKRLDRIAVVGVNGAGKSTLLKIIAGHADATEGKMTLGASINLGYFSQNSLDVLDPKMTIVDEVHSRIPNAGMGTVRSLLGAFKFSGEEAEKKISILSGGEKSRVVLACILAQPVNLLILDEPTNHLDIKSRELLLDAIKNFPGTVMIVSHDRHFLREVTTRVFEVDKNQIRIYDGDYEYYQLKKQQEQMA